MGNAQVSVILLVASDGWRREEPDDVEAGNLKVKLAGAPGRELSLVVRDEYGVRGFPGHRARPS